VLQFSLGLSGFFIGIFGLKHDYRQAAGWIPEALDKSGVGLGTNPIAGIYDFTMQAGQSIAGSNSASSTLLIALIVTSILCAFLTYFGIILLRIFKND
jgi:hypothetical protein